MAPSPAELNTGATSMHPPRKPNDAIHRLKLYVASGEASSTLATKARGHVYGHC